MSLIRIQSQSTSIKFGKANPWVKGQQLVSLVQIQGCGHRSRHRDQVREVWVWGLVFLVWVHCPRWLHGIGDSSPSHQSSPGQLPGPSGPAGRPPPLRMSHCSSRALTLLSSVFGACGLLLVGIAVSTDYWLYMEEGTVLPQNQTTEVKMALHAGLWRVCFFAGTDLTCPALNGPGPCLEPKSAYS